MFGPGPSLLSALSLRGVGVLLLCSLAAGCGEPPPVATPPDETDLAADLLADLDVAELEGTRGVVDFGTLEDRAALSLGWSRNQEDGGGTNVWALGKESWVELAFLPTHDLVAEVEAASLMFEGAPDQDVEVLLNGVVVDTFRATPALERHRISLPVEAQRAGRNRLGFRFTWSRRPIDVLPNNSDRRDLSVRFYRLGIRGLDASDASPSSTDGILTVPAGASATWFARCDDRTWLRVGERSAPLLVEVIGGDESRQLHRSVLPAGPPEWVDLRADGTSLCRIGVAATEAASRLEALEIHREVTSPAEAGDVGSSTMAAGGASDSDPSTEVAGRSEARKSDVILYLVDTLRADHLSAYGYEKPTSPHLEELARDGILFEQARAQSSWTRAGMVSILSGRTPLAHGVTTRTDALGGEVPVLSEMLGGAGWTTAAWVTNGNVSGNFGLDRGFDSFRYLNESRHRRSFHQLSDVVHDAMVGWSDHRKATTGDAPAFLWLHATDPHAPYAPESPWAETFAPGVDPELGKISIVHDVSRGFEEAPPGTAESWRALYDAEIASNDAQLGRLLDHLRKTGVYDDAVIVFTSDHGEEFADHGGWEHGKTLFEEQLRVPLVVKLPGNARAGTVRTEPVRQIDIVPTILDAVGIERPEGLEGRSLLEEAEGEAPPTYSHVEIDGRQIESLVLGGFKLVADRSLLESARGLELFDLENDPGETVNLWAQEDLVGGWLAQELRRARLRAQSAGPVVREEAELNPELRARLEALGYLNN